MREILALQGVVGPEGEPAEGWAWLGLGSNVGDRLGHLQGALTALGEGVRWVSPLYATEPWGLLDQPEFYNAVVLLEWTGTAQELLARCKQIEQQIGRRARTRNGPRELDIDILVLGSQQVALDGLVVPHVGHASRRSVLEPWGDVAPHLVPPGGTQTVAALRAQMADAPGQGAERVDLPSWPVSAGPVGASS